MTRRIGTIFLLFILGVELTAAGLSIGAQSPNLNSNGKHQSMSNHAVEMEHTADSMKDDIQSTTASAEGLSAPGEKIFECGSPENLHQGSFAWYDYAIVCGMLAISLGIGVFYGFFNNSGSSSSEFLLGSGMSIFPVTLSLTTSFITAIELLGNPSEMFYQGTQFALIVIPMVVVIPVAVKIFYPIYFKLELTSCYEYLGIRFGKEVRILGAILYIIQMSFYTAVAVLAPAIALSKATGLNTRLAVFLIYLVCIFYSSQGGMKAVVIADTFQACVLAVSLILIVALGLFYTGGVEKVFETAAEHKRLEFFNFDPNPTTRHTVFSIVIGGFFYWTSMFCTNQASVQKCMSLKSLKLAKIALGFAILGLIVVFLINFYTGLMVFTHYASCDPLSSGAISAADQLLPFYVMDVYERIPTITGIFVAGIFAASLGTVASALNSLAAVTCEDILTNGFNIKIHPEKGALYAKWMSLGYGMFSFALVFIVELLGGVLQATLTLNGLVGGVTLGLFVLGITFKRANAKGAFYGGIIALTVVIYIGVMAQIFNVDPEPLPLSLEECNCFVNTSQAETYGTIETSGEELLNTIKVETFIAKDYDSSSYVPMSEVDTKMTDAHEFGFTSIYRISYLWYSMIGTLLTILFGVVLSVIIDVIKSRRLLQITHIDPHLRRKSIIVNMDKNEKLPNISESIQTKYANQGNGIKLGVDNFALKIDDEK